MMTTLSKPSKIAILGAGSWGTAVAMHIARHGHSVSLWGQNVDQMEAMLHTRCNQRYLPNIPLPANLTPSSSLNEVLDDAEHVMIAVPSHAFAHVLSQITPPKQGISWLTKGIDPKSNDFLSDLVAHRWGKDYPTAMIAGPSFAGEVARELPTALVIASHHFDYARCLRDLFHHDMMRVYLSDDLLGVQCCGAIKNILAIACGISDGLGYGANAKAALITRGLAEMRRFGLAFGANASTFMGLAGVGDLTLTCTDNQSRNRRFGLYLGQGQTAKQAIEQIGQVVEGLHNTAQIMQIANKKHIEMPICHAVWNVLEEKTSSKSAVSLLMQRPWREEEWDVEA